MTAQSVERNRELYKDYLECKKEGKNILWLVMKYKISSSRIFQIIKLVESTLDKSSK